MEDKYNTEDVDASEAVDRDIQSYQEQLEEEAELIARWEEEEAARYVCGDKDHHYWG